MQAISFQASMKLCRRLAKLAPLNPNADCNTITTLNLTRFNAWHSGTEPVNVLFNMDMLLGMTGVGSET